jgi:hypothetical protein
MRATASNGGHGDGPLLPDHLEPGVGGVTTSSSTSHAKGTISAPSASSSASKAGASTHASGTRGGNSGVAQSALADAVHQGSSTHHAAGFQGNSAQFNPESSKIVEEERLASEKMPKYEGLEERFTLLCKMGE